MMHDAPQGRGWVGVFMNWNDPVRQPGLPGHQRRDPAFVMRLLGEGCRQQRKLPAFRHRPRNQRAVDTAALEDSHRDVADQLVADDLVEQRQERVHRFIQPAKAVRAPRSPEPPRDFAAVFVDRQRTRLDLTDVPHRRGVRPGIAHGKEAVQAVGIERARMGGVGENSLDLAGEAHGVADQRDKQRFGPDRIPRKHQPLVRAVPERDREDALDAGEQLVTPGKIARRQDLGVAMRAEYRSEIARELGTERGLVIDLAIVRDGDPPARIAHRLASSCRQVANGQPPVREADGALVPDFAGVRSAVHQRGVHPLQHGGIDATPVEMKDAGDATHDALTLSQV